MKNRETVENGIDFLRLANVQSNVENEVQTRRAGNTFYAHFKILSYIYAGGKEIDFVTDNPNMRGESMFKFVEFLKKLQISSLTNTIRKRVTFKDVVVHFYTVQEYYVEGQGRSLSTVFDVHNKSLIPQDEKL